MLLALRRWLWEIAWLWNISWALEISGARVKRVNAPCFASPGLLISCSSWLCWLLAGAQGVFLRSVVKHIVLDPGWVGGKQPHASLPPL